MTNTPVMPPSVEAEHPDHIIFYGITWSSDGQRADDRTHRQYRFARRQLADARVIGVAVHERLCTAYKRWLCSRRASLAGQFARNIRVDLTILKS
jgi:hypothetical protein